MANFDNVVNVTVQVGSAQAHVGSDMTAMLYLTDDVGVGFTERVRTYDTLADVKGDSDLTSSSAVDAAEAWFGQTRCGRHFKVGNREAGDADWSAAYDAVRSADTDWLWLCVNERLAHDGVGSDGIDELAATVNPDGNVIMVCQTSDSDVTAGSGGNGFEVMQAASYGNVSGIWHSEDAECADVALCAMMAQDPDYYLTTAAHQNLVGITADDSVVDATKKSTVLGYDASLYLTEATVPVIYGGQTFGGDFLDQRISALWAQWRVDQEVTQALLDKAALGLKIPYDDDGIQYIAGRVKTALERGYEPGHFERGTVTVNAPKAVDVSTATKQSRLLTMTADAKFAGAIGSVHMTIYVTV